MYEPFYGLKEKPFSLLPDPAYLYLSKQHEMAMTLLEYSLENQAGFCVVSGRAGTGKTTLLRQLLNRVGDDVTVGLISNTHHSFGELLRWILHAFSLEDSEKPRAELHQIFIDYLIRQYAKNQRTMLIIDEAQNMSSDALEELRMLSNINSEKDLLLQVILVGQPPLRDILRRPELEQFAQRVAVDYHLDALGREETKGYIRHRILVAGGEAELFTADACDAVFEHSGGIPRLINLLCDFSLVYAYAVQAAVATGELVEQVISERERNGALPIFAHERKSPAKRNPAANAAGGAATHVSRKARRSRAAADVSGTIAMDAYGKALQPVPDISGKHRTSVVEISPAKDVPVTGGAHERNGAMTDNGVSAADVMSPDLQGQPAHESQAQPRTNASGVASLPAGGTEAGHGQASAAPRNGTKIGKMPGRIDMERTSPAPVSPEQGAEDKQAKIVNVSRDAAGKTGRAKPAVTDTPEGDAITPGRFVERRAGVRARSQLRRYVSVAAAVIVLSLAAFAWHVFNRPVGQTALTSTGSSQSPIRGATAAPVTGAVNKPPVSEAGLQGESSGKPSVVPQAGVAPAVARKDPLEQERRELIKRERAAARAISQAAERETEALRKTALARERALAAEHEAALVRKHERVNQLALEAEKARAQARAAAAAVAQKKPQPVNSPQVAVSAEAVPSVPVTANSAPQKTTGAETGAGADASQTGPQVAVSAEAVPSVPVTANSNSVPQKTTEAGTGTDADAPQNSEPVLFTANPCKGPSARFLSTCE